MSEEQDISLEEKIKESKPVVLKPTRRFSARVLDLILVGAAITPIIYFGDLYTFHLHNYIIVQIIFACTFFAYDLLMTVLFGATVGKLLLGLGVTKDTGERIPVANAARRSFFLLVAGLGLLIPPVTIVTTSISYVKARKKVPLIWEKGNRTYAHKITTLRCLWSSLLVVAIAAVFAVPVVADMLKVVPYTGFITALQYNEDYDAVEGKYISSLKQSGREYDESYYKTHKLYSSEGFGYLFNESGFVRGFTYKSIAKYDEDYSAEERDIVAIGITTLLVSDKNNRATYNVSLESFTKIFEHPFENHDISAGGVRVVHTAEPLYEGYEITYTVTFSDYTAETQATETT